LKAERWISINYWWRWRSFKSK